MVELADQDWRDLHAWALRKPVGKGKLEKQSLIGILRLSDTRTPLTYRVYALGCCTGLEFVTARRCQKTRNIHVQLCMHVLCLCALCLTVDASMFSFFLLHQAVHEDRAVQA